MQTIEELLGQVFSVWSISRCWNKQDKYRVWFTVRQSLISKDMNTEVEGCTALDALTRQLVTTQQTEKT
jgi:hypothetical protein